VNAQAAAHIYLTVSTSIIVTGFITFRLCRARWTLSKLLPTADAQLYTGVITILIESAAPLTVFGIISAILQQLKTSGIRQSPEYFVGAKLFEGLFYSFCVSWAMKTSKAPFC
jgi:hypothetical protein